MYHYTKPNHREPHLVEYLASILASKKVLPSGLCDRKRRSRRTGSDGRIARHGAPLSRLPLARVARLAEVRKPKSTSLCRHTSPGSEMSRPTFSAMRRRLLQSRLGQHGGAEPGSLLCLSSAEATILRPLSIATPLHCDTPTAIFAFLPVPSLDLPRSALDTGIECRRCSCDSRWGKLKKRKNWRKRKEKKTSSLLSLNDCLQASDLATWSPCLKGNRLMNGIDLVYLGLEIRGKSLKIAEEVS